MAIYRTVSMSFWTDAKVIDDFTPEDRYFYLYLFTNPHTNLCGCYEISLGQISSEIGYNRDSVIRLLERFENVHDVIRYSPETKEILLLNWHKYNWTKSDRFRKPLLREIGEVKHDGFRDFLTRLSNGEKAVYGINTKCINTNCSDTSVTVTDTVTDTVSDTVTDTVTDTVSSSKHNSKPAKSTESQYSDAFEQTWQIYPRKKEKAAAYKAYKARLKNYTEPELDLAARRYAEECRILGTEERYIKHAATFFGPSLPFVDYLSPDYRPPEPKPMKQAVGNSFHNFEQRNYSDDFHRKLEMAKRGVPKQ